MSYGWRGNFHQELNYHRAWERKEAERGFFLFPSSFLKAYLADVRTHTQQYYNLPSLAYKIGLSSSFVFDREILFQGLPRDGYETRQ